MAHKAHSQHAAPAGHARAQNAGHGDEHHGPSLKAYGGVFLVLMLGTLLTVWAAFQHFSIGWLDLNAPIALTIAIFKATCVVLIFMHVKGSDKLTKLSVIAGIFWLAIMIVLTLGDYLTRDIRILSNY